MADSAIVWSGQQDIKMGPGATSDWLPSLGWLLLDMNGDGSTDLRFEYVIDFMVQPQSGSAVVMQQVSPFVRDAMPLQGGVSIGATPADGNIWSSDADTLVDWESIPGIGLMGAGRWAFVSNAFLGVSFTAADGIHYGWVQITSYPDMRAHIHSWAYESQPGVGLAAGVVPEPSTIALFIVGGLAVIFSTWRRRILARRDS